MLTSFWQWYEKHYRLNITIAAVLFILQLVHLYWLSVDVVLLRLIGPLGLWPEWHWLNIVITLVDYTEIPALLTTSLVYINELRQPLPDGRPGARLKAIGYLILLNSQWLHLFWITDEFVVDQFTGMTTSTVLPMWLAWVAIGIDYLELPVMIDLFRKLGRDIKEGNLAAAAEELKNH